MVGSRRGRAGRLDRRAGLAAAALLLAGCGEPAETRAAPKQEPRPLRLDLSGAERSPLVRRAAERWTGDLDGILERGVLRVLVSYSRTNFFIAKGALRGFELEMFRELQKHLDARRAEGRPPLEVVYLPVPFDELLPTLLQGHGNVAAANLTVTAERAREVRFTEPYLTNVDEILVAHAGAPPVAGWADLAGQSVFVVRGSSYAEHLAGVNAELRARGLAPLDVRLAGRGLGIDDLLELVHSGALSYTVADRHEAELWASALDGLRLEPRITAATGGRLAWAVRPDAPRLQAMLDEFVRAHREGTLIGNVLFKRYFEGTRWVLNPRLDVEDGRLEPYLAPLRRLAEEYGFDWIQLAAQVYQESRFDPQARSEAGAVGLMQLLPATARDMGVTELGDPAQNLLAGVRYMDWLRRSYFDQPGLSEAARVDFSLAAYNAGPGRVKRWRAAAPERGLDPDRWFGQVELLALEDVGLEPVRYVANVYKYALILRLVLDEREPRAEELRQLREAAGR